MENKEDALYALVRAELEAALDPAEQARRGSDALHEIAVGAASFAAQRLPGDIRVRVDNPGGHRAGRTTVEIALADQPFIVDSVRLGLRRLGHRELLLVHPLLALEREADGTVARLGRDEVPRTRESFVYAELRHVGAEAQRLELRVELERALADARCVVGDHAVMLAQLHAHVADLEAHGAELPNGGMDRARELAAMLRWLEAKNFLFMGYRRYRAKRGRRGWEVELEPGSSLGLLRGAADSRFAESGSDAPPPPLVGARLDDERVIFFDKTRTDSTVHRRGRLDSVSVKLLDGDGRPVGFGRFVGLFTHRALRMRPSDIPLLAARRARILASLGAEPGSHTYKTALEAYDCLPVEFLFPAEQADAARCIARIVAAAERRKLEVATVADATNRSFFVSIALPRHSYEERIRDELDVLFEREHGAHHIEHRTSFLDDDLALVHFFCGCDGELDLARLGKLEAEVAAVVERWEDRFEAALLADQPSDRGLRLADAYADAFPESYRVVTSASEAVLDVSHLERLHGGDSPVELGLDFATAYGDAHTHRLKIYLRERPYLTALLSVVHQFGVRVIDATSTEVRALAKPSLWIVSFRIEPMAPGASAAGKVEARALDGLRAALSGRVDSDDLNRLIVGAELDWRSVDVLRAYLEFARQIGQAPRGSAARDALVRHPEAARACVRLFRAYFDPALEAGRAAEVADAERALAAAREPIPNAADDRVFALLENLLAATLRTSFFAGAPAGPHEVALKLGSGKVRGLPPPAPWVEIFVHSCELVGVHLRGGPVARGGLRWSDRPQDVRSEVLALWRTQMVKNGLIVPAGAKGGFALRRPPEDPSAARAEADRLYARFVSALLRVTDDVRDGATSTPPGVVRRDGDDPYLVVAADKGTAHLSDVANRKAAEHRFWLGDAFASGGSNGYDHKREAITARGAWLCARRHFAELGRDPDADGFTAVGIGDMSGDVFGNGLLLMPSAKLVAAFDHRHVFVDPDPDPERAFAERKRLFALPRSSWADYARDALSAGGGVWERGAKRIALSAEARRALGCKADKLSGEELVRAVLRAPVDLLWNGGIGTYVKSSAETHSDVADRANDAVRVDAREVRAKIVAEGGNVGFTQAARVEFALAGGRIDTDAIHNAGGVALSDHEVNFKILLAPRVQSGALSDAERSEVLRACAEPADLAVLESCESQSRALSLELARAARDPERFAQAADQLVARAELDPALERLPSRESLRARGWTRPELAVLLGYTKRMCKAALAPAGPPAHPLVTALFRAYFPAALAERFAAELDGHPLRAAIGATCLVNHVIDRAGVTLVPELTRALGASLCEVLCAWYAAERLIGAEAARAAAPAGDPGVEDAVAQAGALAFALDGRALLDGDDARRRAEGVAALRDALSAHALPALVRALPVVAVAERCRVPVARALEVWNELGARTRVQFVQERLTQVELGDGWNRVGAAALGIEMSRVLVELCERELAKGAARRGARTRAELDGALAAVDEIAAQIDGGSRSLAPLLVLSQRIRRLC